MQIFLSKKFCIMFITKSSQKCHSFPIIFDSNLSMMTIKLLASSNEVSLKSSHAKAVFNNKFDEVDSSVVSVTSNSCTNSSTVSWKILFAGGFLFSFSPVQLN